MTKNMQLDGLKIGGTFFATRDTGKVRQSHFEITRVVGKSRIYARDENGAHVEFAVTAHPNGITSLDGTSTAWSGAV